MKKTILSAIAFTAVAIAGAQTTHNLIVEDTEGKKTSFPKADVAGIVFQEMPAYTEANTLIQAQYSTVGGLGAYDVTFATETPDNDGYPSKIGGMQVALRLMGPASADLSRVSLPTGVYSVGAAGTPFTINVEKSGCYTRNAEGPDGVSVSPVIGGTVDVRHDGSAYDIRMELVTLSGETVDASFDGKIAFGIADSEYSPLTEDQDIRFEGMQGRFYGNWYYPFSDDAKLQGYAGKFDANNSLTEGYWLELEFFMPKVDDPMNPSVKIFDGTYTIEKRNMPLNNTYLPFTFSAGALTDFMGSMYNTGSYVIRKNEDGTGHIGYLDGGTITISENGKKIVFDCVTENGTKITGSFSGSTLMQNFCDNAEKMPPRPWSTVESDIALDFTPENVGAFFFKDKEIVEGLTTYSLQLMDFSENPKGDYVMLTFLSDGPALADGTYAVGNEMKDKTLFPGWYTFAGQMVHSWYGDLDSTDSEGYQTVFAPFNGGTVTVSTADAAKGIRKIVFDVTDDNGHKIKGEYTGFVIDYDSLPQDAPRKAIKGRVSRAGK